MRGPTSYGSISLLDCIVFLIFLTPQLVIHVGLQETVLCIVQALPHLVFQIPFQLIHERYFTPAHHRTPFALRVSLFQDLVIRCVRYAFANIAASMGRVFLSKAVALPFMRFRMIRHGHFRSPLFFTEVKNEAVRGVWIVKDEGKPPDVVVYYLHGGGFSMGSCYFYLEFLMVWVELLITRAGYGNPAVFALEYSLVPDATYPTQLQETVAGYKYVLSRLSDHDSSRICVAGDSAGATLILSLLLSLSSDDNDTIKRGLDHSLEPGTRLLQESLALPKPGFATLLSPWCRLISRQNRNTPSDYLNAETLHLYARQYATSRNLKSTHDHTADTLASPGLTTSTERWPNASPKHGFHFIFGAEEVFAPDARTLVHTITGSGTLPEADGSGKFNDGRNGMQDSDGETAYNVNSSRKRTVHVEVTDESGMVHAWPVVELFLADTAEERFKGLETIVEVMGRRMGRFGP